MSDAMAEQLFFRDLAIGDRFEFVLAPDLPGDTPGVVAYREKTGERTYEIAFADGDQVRVACAPSVRVGRVGVGDNPVRRVGR